MRRTLGIAIAILLVSVNAPAETREAEAAVADSTFAKTILKDSIAIPTVEGRGRVPELAAYYSNVLRNAGFPESDVVITPLGETAMLEATLRGRASDKPILLLGHMDVVEADPADWERDPFTAVEEGGYIFGRGSFDNKFDIAMMIATLARMKREGYQPRQDVVLLLSGDEETSQATTTELAKRYPDAAIALNGDGGGGVLAEDGKAQFYYLQVAEKTYADFRIEFTNPGGHSSRPSRINAITQLSNALSKLGSYEFEPQVSELTMASLRGLSQQVEPALGAAMLRFVEDPTDAEAVSIIRDNPEYAGQIGTTCVATMVDAGHAANALPQRATATINCRIFPGISVEDVKAELARVIDDPDASIEAIWDPVVTDASPLRKDVLDAVTQAVHASYPGIPVVPNMSNYGTDSVIFRAAGIPSYGSSGLFIKPSDNFNHGLNERIPVSSIPGALMHWDSLIRSLTR